MLSPCSAFQLWAWFPLSPAEWSPKEQGFEHENSCIFPQGSQARKSSPQQLNSQGLLSNHCATLATL